MKYNAKYDRWFTTGGLVFRYDKGRDRLVECGNEDPQGYVRFKSHCTDCYVHRGVYETFKGEIPEGYEIDHIDTHRNNNDVNNLRLVTRKENMNNKLTFQHCCKSKNAIFGVKFFQHYNLHELDDRTLHCREYRYFKKHGYCSWEAK